MVGAAAVASVIPQMTSAATETAKAGAGSGSASVPFAGVMQAVMEQTGSLQKQADAAVGGLLSGQGVEVHDAMIATQKADMAFELALAVRNKAVGAYQQMMQMQF